MRSFQVHILESGMPDLVYSDLGTQFVAASNIIKDFLNDEECRAYMKGKGLSPLVFSQFPKGKKELGGVVEICVKMVKRLIYGAVGKLILSREDFDFLIVHVNHLVNKRPVCFKESLRTDTDVPQAITPEMVIHGFELPSLNIIPELQPCDIDSDWMANIHAPESILKSYDKLSKARNKVMSLYRDEFIAELIKQATNEKFRYKPVNHCEVRVGDLVLIKDPNVKPIDFPLGVVEKIVKNYLGEVTELVIYKGKTMERVRRHVSSVVLLLSPNHDYTNTDLPSAQVSDVSATTPVPSRRAAAAASAEKTRGLLSQGLV